MKLCDFTNQGGVRVTLSPSLTSPLVHLRAGRDKGQFAALDVDEARALRDALTRFIDAVDTLAPHAAAYKARLAGTEPEGTPS